MMVERSWFNRACDLEAAGKHDEARALLEANTTEADRQAMAEVGTLIAATFSRSLQFHLPSLNDTVAAALERFRTDVGPKLVAVGNSKAYQGYRKARADPDHPHSRAWLLFDDLDMQQAHILAESLILPARAGRPKGTDRTDDAKLLAEIRLRMKRGEKPTTAARAVVRAGGCKNDGTIKNRADHLVKRLREREK